MVVIGTIDMTGIMKKLTLTVLAAIAFEVASFAQSDDAIQYRRSSVYSILVNHTEQKYADEIFNAFTQIPVPDKYNDHGLSVVALAVDDGSDHFKEIDDFIINNMIASRLVGRWFNRDLNTGVCDMELIKARGLYNASVFDMEVAQRSSRGLSMLQDAGEELIGNTFLLVNEVNYFDKAEASEKAGNILTGIGAFAGAVAAHYTGNSNWFALGTAAGAVTGAVVSTIKGFRVKITTRLYQLVWNDDIAGYFYNQCYTAVPDGVKAGNFERNRNAFKLKYIGMVVSKGNQTSFLGINEDQPLVMIRKACQRAIDENVVDLQKAYEVFRVKSPITAVSDNIVTVPIGMKEGVTAGSLFEVLEPRERPDGRMEYTRVGLIKPVDYKIWDNRFMAKEEGARGADLGCTTFSFRGQKAQLYPGMLVRQIQ